MMVLFVFLVWLWWFTVTTCITLFLILAIGACMVVAGILRLCRQQEAARFAWGVAMAIAGVSDAMNRPIHSLRSTHRRIVK